MFALHQLRLRLLNKPWAACAGADHFDHHFGIKSRALCQDHRFGSRDVVDCDQMIGDELHPAAIAEPAEIRALLGEVGEEARTLCDRVAVAAGVDHEIAVFCLSAGSAEWTIQRNMTSLGQSS